MSILDELNAELGLDEESPAIGSPEERELALEAADLPSLVPTEISDLSAFVPPVESPASVSPGIINAPSIPKLTSTSAIAGSAPETGKIYRTAMQTLGQYPDTIESANAELGGVALEPKKPYATPLPETIQESSIDRANRELQYGSPLKMGDTRDTQSPRLLMPSFYDTEIPPDPEKPRKGIITEALHAPVYGVAQLGQIAAGLTAIAGEAFNSDAITELAKNMYNKSTEFMEPFKPTVQDIRDIGGIGDATRWAVSSIGQMLPFMIGTMGAGAAIKTLITHTLGRSIARKAATTAISRGLADMSVKESIGKAMTDLGIKAGMGGMAAATIGAEAGIISSDRLTNGLKVLSSDLLWAIPAGMLDVIPEWRLASKLNLFGKRISNIAMRDGIDVARNTFVKEFGKQALLEGITEGWQEILEEAGAGRKPFTYDTMWQAINAFMAAGLAGGVMGAGVNLLTRTPSTPTAETITPKLGEPGFIGPMVPGIETYAPTTLALPPGQGFTLVDKPGSVLHKAWNVPPEAPAPEIFTLQEGRYRPPGKERPTERPGWMGPMEEYYDMLRPTKGEGFVTVPTRKTPPAPTEVISRGAQDLINSQEWAPLQDMWNKLVMGKRETPQLIWGGQYPQHLLYNEREGARGFQSPWVDTEITESGHIVHTDFDGGKLESLFDKDMTAGTEFVPVKYTAPNGDSTILRKGQVLPQPLIDTIQTYLSTRQRVLGETSITTKAPPPLGLPAPVAVTPPVVEGLIYNGIQNVPGEPDLYTFTEKSSGGTFMTKDVTTEHLMRERDRVRSAFEEPDVKDAIDNDLKFDILKSTREQAGPAYEKYGTGQEISYKGEIGWRINESGDTPGTWTIFRSDKPGQLVDAKENEISVPPREEIVPEVKETVDRIPGFQKFMVFSEDGRLSLRAGSVEEQVTHRVVGGRMELGAIFGLVGEVWVDAHTNEVYSLSMYDRKLRGEDVRGIPMDKLDGIQVEGWKSEIAKIDPKFDISERLGPGPIFYSQAERVITEKMSGSMSSTQIANMLRNSGVKPDEMRWTGLDELLKQPKNYTKQEVLDYLRESQVEIREVLHQTAADGTITGEERAGIMPTKFAQWQLPGGENYRELLLTMPYDKQMEGYKIVHPARQGNIEYRSSHWDEPNVLAHIRFNDRVDAQGKRVLFIEEVQSDWHQAGREKGYQGQLPNGFTVQKEQNAFRVISPDGHPVSGAMGYTESEAIKNYGTMNANVPPAPFSKTWHEMAMRRMVRWASENGYDKIAWTTGEQQAARYNLSKQIDKLDWNKKGDIYQLIASRDGNVKLDESVPLGKLADFVGKEVAAKITAGKGSEGVPGYITSVYGEGNVGSLSSLDLKVGGEGMKGFYDKILPEYMNKFGKKWGAKVETININTGQLRTPAESPFEEKWPGGKTEKVHSLDITPAMAESVLQGQPMFRTGQPVTGITKEQAWQVVNDLQLKIPQGTLRFEILNSKDEIPPEVMRKLARAPSPRSRGMYVRSDPIPMVYIFANNNANAAELEKTIFHETLGHFGFERLVGPERIKAVTRMVLDTYGHEELGYLYRRYGVTPGTKDGDYVVSLEKIAEIAETGSNPTLWQRIVVWFKEIMADIFGNEAVGKLTEDEIKVYLWRSRELIQQQNVPSMGQVYNSMTKLISMRMWNMQLPDGPTGVGSFMREDSSPSDENTARNLGGFMSWFRAHKERNKNFGYGVLKDLGIVEAIGSLPHWISMKFPSFKSVVSVQWDREDKRNRDRLHLLQDPSTNAGDNPYIAQKNTEAIDKIVVWSDQNDTYLQDDQLQGKSRELNGRNLTTKEVSAYHGWKAGFDRAVSYAIDKLRQSATKLYSDQPWFEQFKGVIDNTIDQSTVVLDPDQLKDFQKAITKTAERMNRIAEREKQLKSMNFYVPHIRGRGEYVVRVFDTDENGKPVRVWVERFENSTKAEAGRIRLKADYAGLAIEKTYEPRTSEFVYGGLDVPAMEAFLEKATEKAKDKFGVDETAVDKLMDAVYKAIDEEIMARGFRQHYIHRHQGRVIGGYRTEGLHQVFFDYMSGLAGSMTKLDATYDFHKALQSIDKVNERGVYEYATRYVRDMLRNKDAMDRKLNAFKTIPYAWYLSANLRLAVTQMFQNAVTAYPILARLQQESGVKGSAALRLEKAMQDITKYSAGMKGAVSEIELKMLQDAYEQGETLANYINEMKGKVEGNWAKTYFMKLLDVVSIPFAGMERFNRRTSLLAAFRMYTEAGKPYGEAFELSKEFVRHAHYAYGLSNFPQLMRDGTPFSKIAGMAYVFKSFPHNYVLSMLHFAKDKDGKLALGVMMRSIAMLAILGGLTAVPFLDDILEEYEQLSGDPVRSKMRIAMKKYGGDMLGQVGMEGLPALAGVDMSGTVKMQIPIPGIGEFDPSTFTMGVWGGLIDKGKRAIEFASDSQWARAIEAGAPVGVEMMLKARRMAKEGLKTAGERDILDVSGKPIMPTMYETGAQVAGFRPERIAEVQKERRVAQNIKERFSRQRDDIRKRLRRASTQKDFEGIRKDIEKYNLHVMKYRGVIPRISSQSLKSALKPETGYMKYGMVEGEF